MKKLTTLLFILCSFGIAKGSSGDSNQVNRIHRFSIGLSLGMSIPANSFGVPSTFHTITSNDTISGFAKTGFHFDITPRFYFSYWAGLTALIGGNLNSFNSSAYNNSITYSETRTASTQASSYYTGEYMLGLFFTTPIDDEGLHLSFHISIMCGMMTNSFPTVTTTFAASPTQAAGEATWSIENGDGFAGNFNAGLSYKASEHIIYSLDISYSTTDIKYPSGTYTETLQGGPTLTTNTSNPTVMSVGLVKPTLGVGYIF